MPRYLVERTFTDKLNLPVPGQDPSVRLQFIENNALDGVTWVFSYIVPEHNKSYCICEAATPEAVRRAARRNQLPIDRIVEVLGLDPYGFSLV